jgi:hypothetical protein
MAAVRVCVALAVVFAWAAAWAEEKPAAPVPPPAPMTIKATLPTQGDHVPQCVYDGKTDTYWQPSEAPKSGSALTLTFREPAKLKRVEVAGGTPDGKNPVEGALVEWSADGKEFQQAATLKSGAAKADLGGKTVKALRIRWTADAASAPAIREITLDSSPALAVFKYPLEVVMDASEVTDMKDWCARSKQIVEEWWPTLCEALPEEGYTPPRRIDLEFKNDSKGIAATGGGRITAHMGWFKQHPDDYGAIVHEAVHVVQSYHRRVPGWLTEGITDYVRFWVYEPQTPKRRLDIERIKYTDSYQVTGAFLGWLSKTYDKDVVKKLNVACRKGEYKDSTWKDLTGKDLDALWEEFKKGLAKK